MVERTKTEIIEEFDGVVDVITIEPDQINEGQEQYHIEMQPEDKEMLKESKTGKFHTWLRITKSTTNESVAEGSVLDNYLKEVEAVFKDAKDKKTVLEALQVMKDKKVHFIKKTLGKSYKGHESKQIFVPQRLL